MVSSSDSVGSSSGSNTSAGNDRAGSSGKNDRNNEKPSKNGSPSSKGSDRTSHSGNHESERAGIGGSKKDSFDSAMSAAAKNVDQTADKAARDNFAHANEFSSLTSTGGPASREHASEFSGLGPSGNASLNSHRGYGPDDSLAGGIDQDVDAGLEARSGDEKAPVDGADFVGDMGRKGTLAQAGIETARNTVDYQARGGAANTLTNGRAANLPGRADLAAQFRDTRTIARDMLDATPYGPNAKSTQQLATGANRAAALNAAAKTIGFGAQPAAGAIEAYMETPESASAAKTALNTARGAFLEVDDAAVSYGAGALASLGVVAVSPATGPAAPAVVAAGAPAAGVAAAIGAGASYNNSFVDRGYDAVVNAAFGGIEFAAGKANDAVGYIAENVDRWEREIIEKAAQDFQSSAKWRR